MIGVYKDRFRMSTVNHIQTSTIIASKPVVTNSTTSIDSFKSSGSNTLVRTVGGEQSFTFQFDSMKAVDIVHLNKTNLAAGSTSRIRLYLGGVVVYDTGVQIVVPAQPLGSYGMHFGLIPLGGSLASSSGNLPDFTIQLPLAIIADACVIDIFALNNTFIDVSKVLVSTLFSPISINIAYGLSLSYKNTNITQRAAGGGAVVSKKFTIRVITLSIEKYSETDRSTLADIFKRYTGDPMFITCFPTYGGVQERDYSGMFVISNSDLNITHPYYGAFDTSSITFEEI